MEYKGDLHGPKYWIVTCELLAVFVPCIPSSSVILVLNLWLCITCFLSSICCTDYVMLLDWLQGKKFMWCNILLHRISYTVLLFKVPVNIIFSLFRDMFDSNIGEKNYEKYRDIMLLNSYFSKLYNINFQGKFSNKVCVDHHR